ncbi:MAG: beta-galactosidase small subunit, partial [Clostridia bacterium]|nr:beta-galactosidase small subunit [Clostridia bacterium]
QKDENSVIIDTAISLGSHSHPPIIKAEVRWKFGADGVLCVSCKGNVRQNAPCLPRFGLLFTLPRSFESVRYFGLGNKETYPDRYRSQKFSAYETTVSDLFEHYVRPQENGNRFATRYAQISDGKTALFFERDNGEDFCFSASHFSHDTLINTAHDFELTEENATYLHVDYKVNAISENGELDVPENTRIFGEKEFSFGFCFI